MWLARQSRATLTLPSRLPLRATGRWRTAAVKSDYSTDSLASKASPEASGDRAAVSDSPEHDLHRNEASAFKQQRFADLAKARDGDSPVITESHPRLQSSPDHMSIASFRSHFSKIESEKSSNPSVHSSTSAKPPPRANPDSDQIPTPSEFDERLGQAEREATVLRATLTGRIRSKRVVGSGLVFVDIVNGFQRVQVMINKKKCLETGHRHAFKMWRNLIQVGDHICMSYLSLSPRNSSLTCCLRSCNWSVQVDRRG